MGPVKRDKPDLSRLVTLDLSPTEAAILVGILEGVKRARGEQLGIPLVDLIDGTVQHIRLQLRQLHWPQGHKNKIMPYPI